jgi:aspartate kinase
MSVTVLKIGGSVITGADAYARVALGLQRRLLDVPDERLLVVVSAQSGVTDGLLAEARALASEPASDAVDLLWSTGELRSVALLTLALREAGISAIGLNVHETGVHVEGGATRTRLRRVQSTLETYRAVVVPGFLAADGEGRIVSLGRGGSDLTAVLFARALGAACELVKDVPGYFTADPNRRADVSHVPALTYDEALALADDGCDLVQRRAIEAAAQAGIPLTIRRLDGHGTRSVVGPGR